VRAQGEYQRVKSGFAELLDYLRQTEPQPTADDVIEKYGISREAWDAIPDAPAKQDGATP